MKRILAGLALAAVAALPLRAIAQDDDMAINHEFPTESGPTSKGDPEAYAEDLRLKGKCNEAVDILRKLVDGGGDRIAQYDLGLCLLDLAARESDARRADSLRREGASWIVASADRGFGKAEAEAARIYLDGTGVPRDPVEAEKWALLYRSNVTRLTLGLPDLDDNTQTRLDSALNDAQRSEAEDRARDFTPTGPEE